MRLLTTICALALVVALCAPAFAETQNVKVSGDITIRHFFQNNMDLNKDDGDGTVTAEDGDTHFMQTLGLNVAADLTDNVSTYVRLINERDWNDDNSVDNFDVELDQAYITLQEVLYAPLTLKLGRQDMLFGKGMIIGDNSTVWGNNGEIVDFEYSDLKAFDALRATLDYDPWTIDLVYSKIDENTIGVNTNQQDDIDLYGLNIGYLFDKYQAEAEGYVWHRHDQSNKNTYDTNECTTLGLRGSFVPYENMNVWSEGAVQVGKEHDTTGATTRKDREAFLFDIGADYTFKDVKWTPLLGLEYLYLSGDGTDTGGGEFEGWDPMYRARCCNLIRDFMDNTNNTDAVAARGRSSGLTNQHSCVISGGLDFMNDLTLDAKFSMYWFDEPIVTPSGDTEIGQELDGFLTYDYTEDVQFKLDAGIFWPDNAYDSMNSCDDYASRVISSVKVEF